MEGMQKDSLPGKHFLLAASNHHKKLICSIQTMKRKLVYMIWESVIVRSQMNAYKPWHPVY